MLHKGLLAMLHKKLLVSVMVFAMFSGVSGCAAVKQWMGYDRYEWDENVSYIDEPHRLPCKQRSTKDAPRLCDGTLVSEALRQREEEAKAEAAKNASR